MEDCKDDCKEDCAMLWGTLETGGGADEKEVWRMHTTRHLTAHMHSGVYDSASLRSTQSLGIEAGPPLVEDAGDFVMVSLDFGFVFI